MPETNIITATDTLTRQNPNTGNIVQSTNHRLKVGHPSRSAYSLSPNALVCSLLILVVQLVPAITSQSNNNLLSSQHFTNRDSGHFTIAELCSTRSQFPSLRRVDGAVLMSTTEIDVNCTVTFKTRSARQHFIVRFEELKLDCNDHLKIYDSDTNYGQSSIKEYSCRDNIASAQPFKTTSTFLTITYTADRRSRPGDGFRLVATAVIDGPSWDCPSDNAVCRNTFCISKSLFCDGVNHCIDDSDELNCGHDQTSNGWSLDGDLNLSNALGLLVILVLIISACVIIFISAVYCRRDNHYVEYQHHLQRDIGVPLQTSPWGIQPPVGQIIVLRPNGP